MSCIDEDHRGHPPVKRLRHPVQRKRERWEQTWAEEAERRYRELKTGVVEAVPSEEVFRAVRSRLR